MKMETNIKLFLLVYLFFYFIFNVFIFPESHQFEKFSNYVLTVICIVQLYVFIKKDD